VNDGFTPAEHMMLYHCNFGFPVVSPDSVLELDAETFPRDAIAEAGLSRHRRFDPPTPGYAEQAFFHRVKADAAGYAQAQITNPKIGLGVYVRYRQAELPCLIQWKMMGAGEYVCGLEPATSWVTGRAQARQDGLLRVLAPGERVQYDVEIGVLA